MGVSEVLSDKGQTVMVRVVINQPQCITVRCVSALCCFRWLRVPVLTPVHHRKHLQWASELEPWSNERRWPALMNNLFEVYRADCMVCVCVAYQRAPGCTVEERQGKGKAPGNVLLEILGSSHASGCPFDTYHLREHSYEPSLLQLQHCSLMAVAS